MSNVFVYPTMDLTPAFARTQSHEEDSLEGQVLEGGLLKVFKRNLNKLNYQRKFLRGGCLCDP